MKLVFLALLGVLVSCATPYQKSGFRGGYTETRLANDMYEVHFKGNGYTDSQTVKSYLLRRCAELTQMSGYTHFVPVSSEKNVDRSYQASFNNSLNQVNVSEISKHGNSVVIKLLNNPDSKTFALDAYMILGKDSQSNRLPAWND